MEAKRLVSTGPPFGETYSTPEAAIHAAREKDRAFANLCEPMLRVEAVHYCDSSLTLVLAGSTSLTVRSTGDAIETTLDAAVSVGQGPSADDRLNLTYLGRCEHEVVWARGETAAAMIGCRLAAVAPHGRVLLLTFPEIYCAMMFSAYREADSGDPILVWDYAEER